MHAAKRLRWLQRICYSAAAAARGRQHAVPAAAEFSASKLRSASKLLLPCKHGCLPLRLTHAPRWGAGTDPGAAPPAGRHHT